ncbi:Adenosine/adenine deaminase [Penicillium hispanicum]|uniref:Adenosine/adenine deaminase n=1 Tax=Penicillium hispanicum TaxID=1080232 RepID=UPI0025412016|nr:Adenosine/adenine deaminase [Penicillium hispanicum]KAJ5591527.1 Adenosine/adenine deaminase [Penicillium hispanicum]
MCQSDLHEFLQGLPKCEHHVHLEGCMSPELIFHLAERNGITLPDPATDPAYTSVAALTARYDRFTSLDDFLHYYFAGMAVLCSERDFADLAWSYFQKAHADGVHHAEVFFDPQVHMGRGIPYQTIVAGFAEGCRRAERELGLSTKLILCFVRHLPVSSAKEVYGQFISHEHFGADLVHGLGWSSSEVGPPKDMFRDIYASAAQKNIPLTAHAGEEGDPTYISTALELGAQRIDHGIRLVEDPELMQRVAREGILLTVCPLSNVQLRCVPSVAQVPIRRFLEAGVKFSINSDDPAYFGGYILDNYCAVQKAFQLSVPEWRIIAENSVQESWISDTRKAELLERIEAHVKKHMPIAV